MRLTMRQLNRATLARQWLLARRSADVVDAVRALCALQAQSPASPYLALWNRVAGFDAGALDAAFADHRIVKASLMRMTLHAVAADDYPAFQRAMSIALRRTRPRDGDGSTAKADADRDALLEMLLAYAGTPRSNAEMDAAVTERLGPVAESGGGWSSLRWRARLVHAPTPNAWSFGDRPSFLAAPVGPFDGSDDDALSTLVRRYLEAFGPASASDIGQFTSVPMAPIRAALDALAGELEAHEGPDGALLHDIAGMAVPDEDEPAPPRLMAMWDSILFAYRDRSRVIPDAYRRAVIRTNGDTLPTVLVDGFVAGVWRPAADGDGGIEVTAFHALDEPTWHALAGEATALVAFVAGRQPDVYRRYGRWWSDLPTADVRVLGGPAA